MFWSSWGTNGYAVGVAKSETGEVNGSWIQQETPVFPENGGHGMVFRDKEENLQFVLHYPCLLYTSSDYKCFHFKMALPFIKISIY